MLLVFERRYSPHMSLDVIFRVKNSVSRAHAATTRTSLYAV